MKQRCIWIVAAAMLLVAALAANSAAQAVTVAEVVICRDVMDRAPVGAAEVIPADTARVYCFTRVEGATADTEITHNWYYQGSLKASVVLPVRGRDWRTWSSKRLIPAWKGEWMVEVLGQDGTALASVVFVVQ
jgi:hypothetical protein